MSAKVPAKSILKPHAVQHKPVVTDEQKAQAEKDKKNLSIALKHAYLIQHRKDVEASILDAITVLIDFPAEATFTTKEGLIYTNLLKPFQPSDFDSLVEERNIDGKCGYALCLNKPRSQTMGETAAWKLKKGMSDYCGNGCAKKGLYLKSQLSEVPAWERVPEQQPEIQLHEDDQPAQDEDAVRRANRTARVNEWRQKVANDAELAMERGEKTTSLRPNQVMADTVVEKKPKPFKAPMAAVGPGHANTIEGYQTKRYGKSKEEDEGSDEDDENDGD